MRGLLGTLTAMHSNKRIATNAIWLVPVGGALSVIIALATAGRSWSSATLYGLVALILAGFVTYSVTQLVKIAEKPHRRTP